MLFSSFGSEVDTAPIIERLDEERRRVVLPRTEGREMLSVTYRPGDAASVAPFGAMEPAGGAIVEPEEIDAVIVPGLAFDRAGYRVGYGGGFFDRFLAKARADALRIGICFALQVVDEVPRGATDLPVDVIVTDEGTLRCR